MFEDDDIVGDDDLNASITDDVLDYANLTDSWAVTLGQARKHHRLGLISEVGQGLGVGVGSGRCSGPGPCHAQARVRMGLVRRRAPYTPWPLSPTPHHTPRGLSLPRPITHPVACTIPRTFHRSRTRT